MLPYFFHSIVVTNFDKVCFFFVCFFAVPSSALFGYCDVDMD